MIKIEERTLTASLCVAVVEFLNPIHIGGVQICLTDCLTDCCFHRTIYKQKNVWRNLTASQCFRAAVKMAAQLRKTSVTVK